MLENASWRVVVDPRTLAVEAAPAQGRPWVVSAPVAPARVNRVERRAGNASWQWGDYAVRMHLHAQVLDVTFTPVMPGELTWPRVPQTLNGLLLPLKEGHYVRAGDRAWREALAAEHAQLSTTEDLSLPALGAENGQHSLSWLFPVAFDNTLHFDVGEAGVGWHVNHRFTALEPQRRYHVRVVLSDHDLLAPGKAWRQWLLGQARFVSLEEKIHANPAAKRLIGASHLYLWGGDWAQALTPLIAAGLPRLWLGLPQWTQGTHAPATVAQAVAAGYLIAPYDSYDTALPPGNARPTWLTAQLGEQAWRTCAVVREDGSRQPGFGGEGVYTHTGCVRPLMEARVAGLLAQAPFNSWFLDVAATGMLFNNHDPAQLTTQRQDADHRLAAMGWLGQAKGLVVGSEVGGAVVDETALFAHGMQTSGFGWNDPHMRQQRNSPYYLGRWWPEQAPEVFFKPAQLKARYRQLYFNPASRLPLFQAAYHDSVITTDHWTLDGLKFPEVQTTRALLGQLYNVPPLLNLAAGNAAARMGWLRANDAFFRPLHLRLHNQALVDFRWLNEHGTVQQATYADGTRIVANFTREPWDGQPGQSAFAYAEQGAEPIRWQVPLVQPAG
ncbi:glycoside hydrolase [Pseudomonas sp. KNUC1026]|uniref:glycoside hydrolase n=1 Tax=Pseudomonas sp. KNUC1026 TaxID=2893890 RepID=UPI001F4867E7|nr:glycoside hydrolase [Pseudomonas sp. KNUC1026]UFH50722.1 glycoside hydrolase [Pseudomonas sp. KNUC1026]